MRLESFRFRNMLGPLVAIAACAYLAFALLGNRGRDGSVARIAGTPAPSFEAPRIDGALFRLKDSHGKVVVLDFWATWCPPCVRSLPHVRALHEELKAHEDFVLVGVSLDTDREAVVRTLARAGAEWPVVFPGRVRASQIAQSFGVASIPTLVVIDRDGDIRATSHDVASVSRLARELLAR